MVRLFVAVWPPPDVMELLAGLARPPRDGLRWTTAEQWHVTLRFLGEADADEVRDLLVGLASVAEMVEARLGPAVGRFGQRVLHVPVRGLEVVAGEVIRRTAAVGRAPEDRPFSGHVTLARVREARGGRGRARVDLRPLEGARIEARWAVRDVTLVASRLHPHGARYDVIDRLPLG